MGEVAIVGLLQECRNGTAKDRMQMGNVESQSLNLPIRAPFPRIRRAIRSRKCVEMYGN